MKILLMGGRMLAPDCLEYALEQGHMVDVWPNTDEPTEDIWYRSVVKIAQEANLLIWQGNPNRKLEEVKAQNYDVAFGLTYIRILKQSFLDLFPKGVINVHYAPLPRYRGFYPVMRAIMNGEIVHGTTMHYMVPQVDAGDIICQKSFPLLKTDTGLIAYQRATNVSIEMFKEMLPRIAKGTAPRIPQDHSKATYYYKEIVNNGIVDFAKSETEIYNFVRALIFPPFPGPKVVVGECVYEINHDPISKADFSIA